MLHQRLSGELFGPIPCVMQHLNKRLKKIHQVLGDDSLKFPGADDILDLEAEPTAMMEIPEPKILKCENVSFMAKDKLLIAGISVECTPGSLTAIMGPSGMLSLFIEVIWSEAQTV